MTAVPRGRTGVLPLIALPLLAALAAAPPEVYPGMQLAATIVAAALGLLLVIQVERPADGVPLFLLALAFPLGLSHLFAVDRGGSVDAIIQFGVAVVLFLAARALPAPARRGLLILLVLTGAVLSLDGMWQFAFGFDAALADRALSEAVRTRLEAGRVFGPFPVPSAFASFLMLCLPVAVAFGLERGGRMRRLAGVAAVLIGIALLLTRSHGALLAGGAAAVLWWVRPVGRRPRWIPVVLALGAVLITATIAWRGGVLFEGAEANGPAALRLRNAVVAARMIADHPLAGVGGGGFGSAYTAYRRAGDNETRYAHDSYLQVLAEHGLPAALPLGLVLLGLAGRVAAARRSGDPLAGGAAFGLTVFALHNLWDFPALLPSLLWIAALLAGTVAAETSDPGGTAAVAPERIRQGGTRHLLRPAAAALVVLGLLVGVRAALARIEMDRAEAAIEEKRPTDVLDAARRAERLAPWQSGPALLQAETLLRHPELERDAAAARTAALAAAARAVDRNRALPVARRTLALACAAASDPGSAAAALQRAADLYPLADSYRTEFEALAVRLRETRP
jgi:O-antigen ligase